MTVEELLKLMSEADVGTYVLICDSLNEKPTYSHQLSAFKSGHNWVYIDEGLDSMPIDPETWASVVIEDRCGVSFS